MTRRAAYPYRKLLGRGGRILRKNNWGARKVGGYLKEKRIARLIDLFTSRRGGNDGARGRRSTEVEGKKEKRKRNEPTTGGRQKERRNRESSSS